MRVLSGERKPVVGHLCDSSISPYHPFTQSICPCPSLFLSITCSLPRCHSLTFPIFLSTSNFTSHPQGYHTSTTKTDCFSSVCVSLGVLFSDGRTTVKHQSHFFCCSVSASPFKHFRLCWLPLFFSSLSLIHIRKKTHTSHTSTHCPNMVCASWFTSDQKLIGKMPVPSVLTQTRRHTALDPALWLINFPDRACPTRKCSPSSLCHTQSVPPLCCVSLPCLAHFSSPWSLIAFAQNVRAKNVKS